MKKIPVGEGRFALVDDFDYVALSEFKWTTNRDGYPSRRQGDKRIFMHREILVPERNQIVDHINQDKTDNRRSNLRLCTRAQNGRNRSKPKHNTSGFKGVHWYKAYQKWQVYTMVNRKRIHVGYFENLNEAIMAHDEAIKTYHGEFACPNGVL